jgi:hypothetical protein
VLIRDKKKPRPNQRYHNKKADNSNSQRHHTPPVAPHNIIQNSTIPKDSPLSFLPPLPNNFPPPNLSLHILKSPLPLSPALPTPNKPDVIPALQHARRAHSQLRDLSCLLALRLREPA